MDIKAQKQQARHYVAERLAKMTDKNRAAESRSVCRRLLENLPKPPLTICAYHTMPRSEIDLVPLLQELLTKGYTIALPKTEGKGFVFRKISSMGTLMTGPFNIKEPTDDDPPLDLVTIDIILIPASAFDLAGNRLGRGNGGYDQWVRKVRGLNPNVKVWGIAFEDQIINAVPVEPHDEKVDALITDRGMQIIDKSKAVRQ
jgi:5-formyltetrahydrofolate cyclo-ligase